MSENINCNTYENIETFIVHNILVGINTNSNLNAEIETLLINSKKYDELFNEKLSELLKSIIINKYKESLKKIYYQIDLVKWKEQKIRDNIYTYIKLKNKDIWNNETLICNDVIYSLGRVAYFINEELK